MTDDEAIELEIERQLQLLREASEDDVQPIFSSTFDVSLLNKYEKEAITNVPDVDPLDDLVAAIDQRNRDRDEIINNYVSIVDEMEVSKRDVPVWVEDEEEEEDAPTEPIPIPTSPPPPVRVPSPESDDELERMEELFIIEQAAAAEREAIRKREIEEEIHRIEVDRIAREEELAASHAAAIRAAATRLRELEEEAQEEARRESESKEMKKMRAEERITRDVMQHLRELSITEKRLLMQEDRYSASYMAKCRAAANGEKRSMFIEDQASRRQWEKTAELRAALEKQQEEQKRAAALFVARREAMFLREKRASVLCVQNRLKRAFRTWIEWQKACEMARVNMKPQIVRVTVNENGVICGDRGAGEIGSSDIWGSLCSWQRHVPMKCRVPRSTRVGRRKGDVIVDQSHPITDALLAMASEDPVTASHMSLSLEGITDMSAIGVCKNLETLVLNVNAIAHINGLGNCRSLRELYLRDNHITSIDGLTHLSLLSHLRLDINKLTGIDGLENCTALRTLRLDHNAIGPSVSCVPHSLERLGLCDNKVETVRLDHVTSLQHLDLGRNRLTNVEGIDGCQILRSLLLYQNALGSFPRDSLSSPLLEELWMSRNGLTGKLALTWWLPMLTHLDLSDNGITALAPMDACHWLAKLNVSFNSIDGLASIHALSKCHKLTILEMHDNPIASHKAYRDVVLTVVPSVTSLDHHMVPDSARNHALMESCHRDWHVMYTRLQRAILCNAPVVRLDKDESEGVDERVSLYWEMCGDQLKESTALRVAQTNVERRYGEEELDDREVHAPVWLRDQHAVLKRALARQHLKEHRQFAPAKRRGRIITHDMTCTPAGFIRNAAALRIQSLWRAWVVRSSPSNPWPERRAEWCKERDQAKDKAATLLQAVLRGHRVRKIVSDARLEDDGLEELGDAWWESLPDISPPASPVPNWDDGVPFEGALLDGAIVTGDYWYDTTDLADIEREIELIDTTNIDDIDAPSEIYYDGVDNVLATPRRGFSAEARLVLPPTEDMPEYDDPMPTSRSTVSIAKESEEADKLAAEWGFKDKTAAMTMVRRQKRMKRVIGKTDDRRRAVDPSLRGTRRFETETISDDVVAYAYADRKGDLKAKHTPSKPPAWGSGRTGRGGGTRGRRRGGKPAWVAEMRSESRGSTQSEPPRFRGALPTVAPDLDDLSSKRKE